MPQPAGDAKDADLTAAEAKQLGEAFKDETFRKLMAEYVNEISDPKHREETEAYLARLEAQNEVPPGKMLVRPSAGFVVKCTHRKKRDGADVPKSKLFLNMVYAEAVAPPTASKSAAEGGGARWSVPYALGPLRIERDKVGRTGVPTFDCCFHPLTLRHAHGRREFLDLVVDVAKDAAAHAFRRSGDEAEVDAGYKVLRGVSYKSGSPRALLVARGSEGNQDDKRNDGGKNEDDGVAETHRHDKATAPDAAAASKPSPAPDAAAAPKPSPAEDPGSAATKPLVPKYKIVERGVFDIADHTTENHARAPRRPRQLVVTVCLDEASSAADVVLDVAERRLTIEPGPAATRARYRLDLRLPYPVDARKGNANFVQGTGTLVVTLPVWLERLKLTDLKSAAGDRSPDDKP